MSRSRISALWLLLAFAIPGSAEAVYLIYDCSPTHASSNTNARLAGSITCDPSLGHVGITLNAGADLDMNGHSIICASGQTCPAAVTMSANNSVVSGNDGTIQGRFTRVVNCGTKAGSRVTSLKFDGYTEYGMQDCERVDRNVLIGEADALRAVTMTTGMSSNVNNNYIDGFDYGVVYTGMIGLGSVVHNLFNVVGRPIYFQNWAGAATVTENVFLEDCEAEDPPIDVGSVVDGATYARNICTRSTSGCAQCVAAGRCTTLPTPPFGF